MDRKERRKMLATEARRGAQERNEKRLAKRAARSAADQAEAMEEFCQVMDGVVDEFGVSNARTALDMIREGDAIAKVSDSVGYSLSVLRTVRLTKLVDAPAAFETYYWETWRHEEAAEAGS